MRIIGILSCCGIFVLATVLVTAWLCRYRISRNKRVSYGTMLAGACCFPFLLGVLTTCIEPDIWWSREHKMTPGIVLKVLGSLAGVAILPSLGVVAYYQRLVKSNETPQS